jgi:hypothetical protein
LAVSNTPVFRSTFDSKPDLKTKPPKGTVMAKIKFRPLHDRVVVKRIDAEEKTKGGIIIPDSEVKLDGEELLIMKESDIMGVLA